MNISHYEKGFTYTDRELLKIARLLGKLATYCKQVKNEASLIRVEAERRNTKKERDQFKVAIRLELPDKWLTAESRRPDVMEALDRCVEKLEPQVKRYKDKYLQARRPRRTA
jgi:ribosomal subunit interface protein